MKKVIKNQLVLCCFCLLAFGSSKGQTKIDAGVHYSTKVFDGQVTEFVGFVDNTIPVFQRVDYEIGGVAFDLGVSTKMKDKLFLKVHLLAYYTGHGQGKFDPDPETCLTADKTSLSNWLRSQLRIESAYVLLKREKLEFYFLAGLNTAFIDQRDEISCRNMDVSVGLHGGISMSFNSKFNVELTYDQNFDQFLLGITKSFKL